MWVLQETLAPPRWQSTALISAIWMNNTSAIWWRCYAVGACLLQDVFSLILNEHITRSSALLRSVCLEGLGVTVNRPEVLLRRPQTQDAFIFQWTPSRNQWVVWVMQQLTIFGPIPSLRALARVFNSPVKYGWFWFLVFINLHNWCKY